MPEQQLDHPKEPRFMRERYQTSTGIYTATFAVRFNGTEVLVGASFCSPKDCFSKVRGRVRATRKLDREPVTLPLTVDEYLALEGYDRKKYLVTQAPPLMGYCPQRIQANVEPLSIE